MNETLTMYEGCECIKEILYQFFLTIKHQRGYVFGTDTSFSYFRKITIELLTNKKIKTFVQYFLNEKIKIAYYDMETSEQGNVSFPIQDITDKIMFYNIIEKIETGVHSYEKQIDLFNNIIEIKLFLYVGLFPSDRIQLGSELLNSLFSYAIYDQIINKFKLNVQSLFKTLDKPILFQNFKFMDPLPMTFVTKPKTIITELIDSFTNPSVRIDRSELLPVVPSIVTTTVVIPPKSGGIRYRKLKIQF